MGPLLSLRDRQQIFENIVVHPVQELMVPSGTFFRGGPEWPYFHSQVLVRHCRGKIPYAIDRRPRPAEGPVESLDRAAWGGPIINHFGHMVADFGMRIAVSGCRDPALPLLFSMATTGRAEPPPFFWQLVEHLGVARDRVILVRRPLRIARLAVLPQAERRFGGGPSAQHLDFMEALAAPSAPPERDIPYVFVSRAMRRKGRFAGEAHLDEALAAAGVMVFHPEKVDLESQLRLYRRARCLIFSEGSAVYGLQLIGRIDADVVVLTRRPRGRIGFSSLRPRVRSLRYLRALRGLLYGLRASGSAEPDTGISILDERRCLDGFAELGIDLARYWDPAAFRERRDSDVAQWVERRMTRPANAREPAAIEARLRALSLRT